MCRVDGLRHLGLDHHLALDDQIRDVAANWHTPVHDLEWDIPIDAQSSPTKLDDERMRIDRLEEAEPQRIVDAVHGIDDLIRDIAVQQAARAW